MHFHSDAAGQENNDKNVIKLGLAPQSAQAQLLAPHSA
jgi:hypothetical protein